MLRSTPRPFVRERHGHARVTNEELFFDLIYAFAVTQLSHRLVEHPSWANALQTLVLWFAVWLGWQYTAWVTNWFNPENRGMRLMLFAVMFVGLLMASAIPDAFAERGLMFALCYAGIQVGRSAFVLLRLARGHALQANFQRIFGWLCISAVLWVAGGLAEGDTRLAFWCAAVLCEYLSPMAGFWLPGLGRSRTKDWTIAGGHLAERCQLFVIVALGESILATGASFSASAHWDAATFIAIGVAFAGSLAMWWIYFDTSSADGAEAIENAADPGRIGANFHYTHVVLIAGIIVAAVADELVVHHPHEAVDATTAGVLVGGPLLYLLGNIGYKRVVYGAMPFSHGIGMGLLLAVGGVALAAPADRLVIGSLTSLVMIVVAAQQSRFRRELPVHHRREPSSNHPAPPPP